MELLIVAGILGVAIGIGIVAGMVAFLTTVAWYLASRKTRGEE